MFKKILAFLIKIPHSLIAIMRYLFSQNWQFAISEPSAHYVKDGQLVSWWTPPSTFLKDKIGWCTQLAKNQKA
ncbi:MAG: hypothetical protein WAW11_00715 [Patescibacteria group bacterium]